MNFAEFANDYIERKGTTERWKPATLTTYRDLLRQYILPAMSDKSVSEIVSADYDRMVASMFRIGVSTRRVNMAIILLNNIMRDAFDNRETDRSLSYKTKQLSKDDREEKECVPFSMDETKAVLEALDDEYRPLFMLMAYTGCRPNELLVLRWSDVNFKKGEIEIRRGMSDGVEGKTKTCHNREIPMVGPARELLNELNKNRKGLSSLVFVRSDGTTGLDGHHLYRVWGTACRKAGVPYRKPYALRHSFAVNSLKGGLPITTVKKLLGHKSLRTTINTYLRDSQIEKQDIDKLRSIFG